MSDRDPEVLQRQLSEIETRLQSAGAEYALSSDEHRQVLEEILRALQNQKNELTTQILLAQTVRIGTDIHVHASPSSVDAEKPHLIGYLRRWFNQSWATVSLAEFCGRDQSASLLDIYVPLPIDYWLSYKTEGLKIVDWWRDDRGEESPEAQPRKAASVMEQRAKQRDWPSLLVGELEVQKIVDRWEQKIEQDVAAGVLKRENYADREYGFHMEAHDAASVQPRFVLVGDPGSGKSSFLHHLCLCMAGEQRRALGDAAVPANASLPSLRDWLLGAYTPLFIEMRDLVARAFPALPQHAFSALLLPTLEDFWRYVDVAILGTAHAGFRPFLEARLMSGQAIVLLDGLDEIAEAADPRRREQVKAFVRVLEQFKQSRILITSRPSAYRRGEWALPGYGRADLEPLSEDRLLELARSLFTTLELEDVERELSQFQAAAERVPEELRANPLYFTLLAAIWLRGDTRSLPNTLAELYRQSLDLMLEKWTLRRGNASSVAELVGLTPEQLRLVLQLVACDVQGRDAGDSGAVVFERKDLQDRIFDVNGRADQAAVLDYLETKAGILLSPEPKRFRFAHGTFQEHLAACELTQPPATRRTPAIEADRIFPDGLAQRLLANPQRWSNVARLAASELLQTQAGAGSRQDDFWRICAGVLRAAHAQDTPAHRQGALLMLSLMLENGLFDAGVEDQRPAGDLRIMRQLALRWLSLAEVAPQQRALCGVVLGRLTDPREAVMQVDKLPLCLVPRGPFLMGSAPDEQGAYRDEQIAGDRALNLDYAYAIGQHPISNAQFAEFVNEGGYRNPDWWTVAIADGVWQEGRVRRRVLFYEDDKQERVGERFEDDDKPRGFGAPFNLPNHPAVGITWYEALAFCAWLEARWRKRGLLTDAQRVRLPNEPEWEKAARGGLMLPADAIIGDIAMLHSQGLPALSQENTIPGRRYPWGNEPSADCANVENTGIGATSAPGCFAAGASPYGCMDMAGNVWDWTRSLWGPWQLQDGKYSADLAFAYPYNADDGRENESAGVQTARVQRGGSWYNDQELARCACRFRDLPGLRDLNLGFRVIVSPFF